MSPAIETNKLTKVYESAFGGQDVPALHEVTLAIQEGEIFGYLGPNGSGKTTTIKMFLNLIFPTSGTIKILGKSDLGSPEVRKQIGYLPEGAYYPDFLKGEEVLKFYGNLYGLGGRDLRRRIDQSLEIVGMTGARKRLIKGYSKGMRQRIGLAQALLSNPQILILDEPTTGLDPIARKDIRDILVRLRGEGKTLFISSHELLEVELISDRVAILYEGRLMTLGTLEELLTNRDVMIRVEGGAPDAVDKLTKRGLKLEDSLNGRITLSIPNNISLYEAMEICKTENMNIVSVAPRRETLEELFVRTVGAAGQAGKAEKKG